MHYSITASLFVQENLHTIIMIFFSDYPNLSQVLA